MNINKSFTCLVGKEDTKTKILYQLYINDISEYKEYHSNEVFSLDKIKDNIIYWNLPEYNTHPYNHLLIAKDLIRLSKNQRIIFTTNSDYIMQHINNMIKLNNNKDKIKLMEEFNYIEKDLLNENEINIYECDNGLQKLKCSKYGFKIKSFNDIIDKLSQEIFAFQEND